MNFLAHVYLSFDQEEIAIGNFIADSIRGKNYLKYPTGIQHGILLHREIDTFTDSHPIPRISSKRLHSRYHHYSRVIVDIYYDHFLAKNWERYSPVPLELFVNRFYDLLEKYYPWLPLPVQHMIPYMLADNWLVSYAEMDGIAKVLQGMNRRTQNKSKMHLAIDDLQEHYKDFEEEFELFFEELILFAKAKLDKLKAENK